MRNVKRIEFSRFCNKSAYRVQILCGFRLQVSGLQTGGQSGNNMSDINSSVTMYMINCFFFNGKKIINQILLPIGLLC